MTNRARILRAAASGKARTLRELAGDTGLDLTCTRRTVRGLRRDGALQIVALRRDAHCSRPVALYALPGAAHESPFACLWAAWCTPVATPAWAV